MGRTLSARPDARKSPGRSRGGPSGRDGRAAGAISPLPVDVILRGRWIDDGSDLLPESDWNRRIAFLNLTPDKTRVMFEAKMGLPGPKVKGLRELTGHLQYRVASGSKEVNLGFKGLTAGATGQELGAQIDAIGADSGNDGPQQLELRLNLKPDELKALYLVVGKQRTELKNHGYSGNDEEYTYTYESESGFPAKGRLVAEVFAEVQVFSAPFKLENISLLGEQR